jgi:hypothetical protein
MRHEPSAWSEKARWKLTGRRSPGWRFEGRMETRVVEAEEGAAKRAPEILPELMRGEWEGQ